VVQGQAVVWAERRAQAEVKATVLYGLCFNLEGDVATEKSVSGANSMAANVGYCDRTDSRPTEGTEG